MPPAHASPDSRPLRRRLAPSCRLNRLINRNLHLFSASERVQLEALVSCGPTCVLYDRHAALLSFRRYHTRFLALPALPSQASSRSKAHLLRHWPAPGVKDGAKRALVAAAAAGASSGELEAARLGGWAALPCCLMLC